MGRPSRIQIRSLLSSGQLRVKYVRVGYGSDSSGVRVWIYFELIMFGSGMSSVQLKSGSGLFPVARR